MNSDVDQSETDDEAHQQVFDAGLAVRRQVLGASYVDAAVERSRETDSADMQQYVTEMVWGSVWTRPGLDRRSRSLVNLGMLVALGQMHELGLHVRGSLRNGLSRDEIVETIIHATAYCGAPAGLAAMRIAQEALTDELGERSSA